MIRFFLDTDDDFDVSAGLDITEEIESWRSYRAVDRLNRNETDGRFEGVLRRGRADLSWWREGRLIEGRVGAFVFFRGFIVGAEGGDYGSTRIVALTWLQFLSWRGRTPDVVGLPVIDALRRLVAAASAGLPGARRPSPALIEATFGEVSPRRLYWRSSERPMSWASAGASMYWREGPQPDAVDYAYGYVGDTDAVGDSLLVGPPSPAVAGSAVASVDRLSAVEYDIENYEYGLYVDELAVLASIERGFVYSGGGVDIACLGRAASASPLGSPMMVTRDLFGRYRYTWGVGFDGLAQVVGRRPDIQPFTGVVYRQESVVVAAGVSSWRVSLRSRGRPAEAAGDMVASWSERMGISVGVSATAGDLLVEVFNSTGSPVRVDWIEVSGALRVYQGGDYGDRVTGRYGAASRELAGVSGGAAGLSSALDYWGKVGAADGPEARSVVLDGRRYAGAWGADLGVLLRTDALQDAGVPGLLDHWIVGIRGEGAPTGVTVEYELMRYVDGGA